MPRKSTLTAEQIEKMTALLKTGAPISAIVKDAGVTTAQANNLKRKLGLVTARKAKAKKAAPAKPARKAGRKPARKAGRKPARKTGRPAGVSSLARLRAQLSSAMNACQALQNELFEKTAAIEAMIQTIKNA